MSLATLALPDKRSRLLLVEDEPALRHALSRYLEKRGMEVARTSSLREAEQELEAIDFDAFIVDVGLPDGDGLSLMAPSRSAKTLIISVNPEPDRFARHGVRHFLAKPFDLTTVAHIVGKIIEPEA